MPTLPYSRSGKSSTQIAWLGLGFTRVRGRLRLRRRVHSPRLSRAAPTAPVATSQPCVHAAEPPPPPSHPAAQGGRCAVLSSRARHDALRPLLSRLRCLADVEDDLTGLVTARQRTFLVVVRGRHGRWPGRCSAASGGLCFRGGCCRACCRRFPLGLSREPPRRRSPRHALFASSSLLAFLSVAPRSLASRSLARLLSSAQSGVPDQSGP